MTREQTISQLKMAIRGRQLLRTKPEEASEEQWQQQIKKANEQLFAAFDAADKIAIKGML